MRIAHFGVRVKYICQLNLNSQHASRTPQRGTRVSRPATLHYSIIPTFQIPAHQLSLDDNMLAFTILGLGFNLRDAV